MEATVHISEKSEHLLDTYRCPEGGRWGGQALQDATGGAVTRSYVTNLLKGRIESPGYDKLAAIAKAMGFAPALWFEDGASERTDAELDARLAVALRDETVRAITLEGSRLPAREREIILGIVRQLGTERT